MKDKLLKDVLTFVEGRLDEGKEWMKTRAERADFQLQTITTNSIRVQRKYDRRGNPNEKREYIPQKDFIDVWEDLKCGEYSQIGYGQKDLQKKMNFHSALIFALAAQVDYIEWRYVDDYGRRVNGDDGGVWKLFLMNE